MTFTITTQPYLDTFNKRYMNILVVNIPPQGPLSQFVRRLQLPKLSPYQQNNYISDSCCLVLTNFFYNRPHRGYNGRNNNLMTPDELPDLYSYLASNGYQIETQLTNLMNQSEVKLTDRRIVCAATYYGNNQPGIVYMK